MAASNGQTSPLAPTTPLAKTASAFPTKNHHNAPTIAKKSATKNASPKAATTHAVHSTTTAASTGPNSLTATLTENAKTANASPTTILPANTNA